MVLGIYGAGALGREVFEIVKDVNADEKRWEKIYYILDKQYIEKTFRNGIKILTPEEFAYLGKESEAVIAVGTPSSRKLMRERLNGMGIRLASPIIHPSSRVIKDNHISEGVVVAYGCSVSFGNDIGQNVYFQPSSGIGHNITIGDDCVISAGTRIAGYVSVGKETYIGMMVPIRDRVKIGSRCIISLGSVVQKDIPDGMIAMGNPARPIRKNISNKIF